MLARRITAADGRVPGRGGRRRRLRLPTYPPGGRRGDAAPAMRCSRYGFITDYLSRQRRAAAHHQIESAKAAAAADAIGAVDGVDMVFIGASTTWWLHRPAGAAGQSQRPRPGRAGRRRHPPLGQAVRQPPSSGAGTGRAVGKGYNLVAGAGRHVHAARGGQGRPGERSRLHGQARQGPLIRLLSQPRCSSGSPARRWRSRRSRCGAAASCCRCSSRRRSSLPSRWIRATRLAPTACRLAGRTAGSAPPVPAAYRDCWAVQIPPGAEQPLRHAQPLRRAAGLQDAAAGTRPPPAAPPGSISSRSNQPGLRLRADRHRLQLGLLTLARHQLRLRPPLHDRRLRAGRRRPARPWACPPPPPWPWRRWPAWRPGRRSAGAAGVSGCARCGADPPRSPRSASPWRCRNGLSRLSQGPRTRYVLVAERTPPGR